MDAIITRFLEFLELVWDAADAAVTRWGFTRTIAVIVAVILFPFFFFALGPTRIAREIKNLGSSTGRGIGEGIRGLFAGIWNGIAGIGQGISWVAGIILAVTRSAAAGMLFLVGFCIAYVAMLVFYPNFRAAFGTPLLTFGAALIAGWFAWRGGRRQLALLILGGAAIMYLLLGLLFYGTVGQGMIFVATLAALIFFTAAREIRGRGSRWANTLLSLVGLIFVGAVGVMFGATTLRIISPGLHQRIANQYDSIWTKSDRADSTERAENAVEGYYNSQLEEKKLEIDQLVADKAPPAVIDAATTEYFALKARADRAVAEAKAKAKPPAPVPPPPPTPPAAAATIPAPEPTPPATPITLTVLNLSDRQINVSCRTVAGSMIQFQGGTEIPAATGPGYKRAYNLVEPSVCRADGLPITPSGATPTETGVIYANSEVRVSN